MPLVLSLRTAARWIPSIVLLATSACGTSGADVAGSTGDGADASSDAAHEAGHDAWSEPAPDAPHDSKDAADAPPDLSHDPATGLTDDFRAWLDAHGYGSYDFPRDDLSGGSYGGRLAPSDPITHVPIVFVHGNSDRAIGGSLGGFSSSIAFFEAKGWTSAELYATTWGPADASQSAYQYHSQAYLVRLRGFVEAVLGYTGAPSIAIVAHSMGVTLARKVVLGGAGHDALGDGDYDLGPPLSARVATFVGIAGANLGLAICYTTGPTTPTCGDTNGFYPGQLVGTQVVGLSAYLSALGATEHYEGARLYTIWSTKDELIAYGDLVWGRYTSEIAGQDGEKRYDTQGFGHMALKNATADVQWAMVSGQPF